jgi:hypothetical protein
LFSAPPDNDVTRIDQWRVKEKKNEGKAEAEAEEA